MSFRLINFLYFNANDEISINYAYSRAGITRAWKNEQS